MTVRSQFSQTLHSVKILLFLSACALSPLIAILQPSSAQAAPSPTEVSATWASNGTKIGISGNLLHNTSVLEKFGYSPGYTGSATVVGKNGATCQATATITTTNDKSGTLSFALKPPIMQQQGQPAPSPPYCTSDSIRTLPTGTIAIGGSKTNQDPPKNVTPTPQTPQQSQIVVTAYSSKPVSELPAGMKVTLTGVGGFREARDLNWGGGSVVAVHFDSQAAGTYQVCVTPAGAIATSQCKTVTKTDGKGAFVEIGTAADAYNEKGRLVNVTVKYDIPQSTGRVTYGPVGITLFKSDGVEVPSDTQTDSFPTGNPDGTGQTPAQQGLSLFAKIDDVEPGTYKVCITGKDLCSPSFIKVSNKPIDVKITVPLDQSDALLAEGASKTNCNGLDGIGWIICPVLTAAAKMVDSIYGWLVSYVEVPAINSDTSDKSNTIYIAWSAARNLANIAFVIGFMIIIYSQLTSAGISNYGIKKLLPRIIIAAILVNVSFWITALAVDASNVIGTSIYNVLINLPLGDVKIASNAWENAMGTLLGGGVLTAGVVGGLAVAAAGTVGAVASAALWTIIPVILGVILGLIITFAILAGRQALIILLIIIAPLAFVALLLPNTEKFFTLWRKSLTTMLIFYPLFALLFAGSNIAALIILGSHGGGSEDPAGGMIVVIALAVQIAPLWLVPFIVKFSGGIIGKMAGMVNNKSKGLIDRSKKVGERKRGLAAHETLGHASNAKNPFGRIYRRATNSGLRDKDRQSAIDAENGAGYNREQGLYDRINNSQATSKVYDAKQESSRLNSAPGIQLTQAIGEADLQSQTDKSAADLRLKATAPLDLILAARISKNSVDAAQAKEDQLVKEVGTHASSARLNAIDPTLRAEAQNAVRSKAVADSATQIAQGIQTEEFATSVQRGGALATAAGGVGGDAGKSRAIANAMNTVSRAAHDNVVAQKTTMRDLSGDQLKNESENTNNSIERRLAAQSMINTVANPKNMMDIIDDMSISRAKQESIITNISSTPDQVAGAKIELNVVKEMQQQFMEDVGGKLPMSIEGKTKGELSAGTYAGLSSDNIIATFNAGNYSGEKMANMTNHELGVVKNVLKSNPGRLDVSQINAIKKSITDYSFAAKSLGKSPTDTISGYLTDIEGL